VGHGHDHTHGGHGHDHAIAADADRGKLAIALGLILGFMAVEVVVGIAASSLALISDAAHMLTDAAAIGLALVAIALARRPARGAFTFGLKRAEILSAQFNGATLLVLGLLVVGEGVRRLIDPPAVDGAPVLIVALAGVVVNLVATAVLARANRGSLNIEGAYRHLLTDLAAFIATAIAGAIILLTGFREADGLAALFVAAIMLWAAFGLLATPGGSSSRPPRAAWTSRRSASRWPPPRASSKSTTSTSGRSPRASRRSPPTWSSGATATATRRAWTCRARCASASGSSTPRCRWTMRAAISCSSRCAATTGCRSPARRVAAASPRQQRGA
jgi:Co/Zn/Cd efflux system component